MPSTTSSADRLNAAPDAVPAERRKLRFDSTGSGCAAWHYPGSNGACVVMAAGLGVTKEVGTDRLAARFSRAGFSVLAFDFRHLGESGGEPRQIASFRRQQADLKAAVACARTLPEVDPARVAIWGFSSSGGHVFHVAAGDPQLAAAIAHAPLADGPAVGPHAMRHQRPLAALRFTGRGIIDALGARAGRRRLLVPLAGPPGTVTSLTSPDALTGAAALNPDGRYPDWRQEIAAASALRVAFARPGRKAPKVACPLLVLVYDQDGVALPAPAAAAGRRAPRGEVVHLPGGHYAAFLDQHEASVAVLLEFLDRHLLTGAPAAGAA